MKIIITESQLENIYDKFLTLQFGNLTRFENFKRRHLFWTEEYPNHSFWKNDNGEVMFELDTIKRLWVSLNVWKTFENFFDLDNTEVRDIIGKWVHDHLNLTHVRVMSAHHKDWERWENLEPI
jgi:hypothetical protein